MKRERKTNYNLFLLKKNSEKKSLENIDLENNLLFNKYYYTLLNNIITILF